MAEAQFRLIQGLIINESYNGISHEFTAFPEIVFHVAGNIDIVTFTDFLKSFIVHRIVRHFPGIDRNLPDPGVNREFSAADIGYSAAG